MRFPAGRGTACRGWLIPAALFSQAEMLLSIYTAGMVALGCQVEFLQIGLTWGFAKVAASGGSAFSGMVLPFTE